MDAARRGVDAATACGVLPLQEENVTIESMPSVMSNQLCLTSYETITSVIRLIQFQYADSRHKLIARCLIDYECSLRQRHLHCKHLRECTLSKTIGQSKVYPF